MSYYLRYAIVSCIYPIDANRSGSALGAAAIGGQARQARRSALRAWAHNVNGTGFQRLFSHGLDKAAWAPTLYSPSSPAKPVRVFRKDLQMSAGDFRPRRRKEIVARLIEKAAQLFSRT
jgi:hypothetical protein